MSKHNHQFKSYLSAQNSLLIIFMLLSLVIISAYHIFTALTIIMEIPDGRYTPDIVLLSPLSSLYPDTVIFISLQGESVMLCNHNT